MMKEAGRVFIEKYKVKHPFFPVVLYEGTFEGRKYFDIQIETGFTNEFDYLFYEKEKTGDGDDWENCIKEILKDHFPEIVVIDLDFNSESSTFLLHGTKRNEQLKIAKLVHEICQNHANLRTYIK